MTFMVECISYFSGFGINLKIVQSKDAITEIKFLNNFPIVAKSDDTVLIKTVKHQLKEYFCGVRKIFDFPIIYTGTDFQKQVWEEIKNIPYGKTITYSELAYRIGKPSSCRAVGTACGKNNLLIVIPCHRIVGKNGNITGYAAGLEIKKKLLNLENSIISSL